MLKTVRGNLLDSDVEALVNTVNTVGIMGKGIALQFKKRFPENAVAYQRACRTGELQPGRVFTFAIDTLNNPRFIINFPTKRHWKTLSRIEDIRSGLVALVDEIRRRGIRSVAVPPLGCGNGGLDWGDVLPLIQTAFANLPDVEAFVFEPAGAPPAAEMTTRTPRPKMTPARAVVLGLMHRYLAAGYPYPLSVLEIQKLAYFMQGAGENLELDFKRNKYGPYADKLRHLLNGIEGHFIVGFGDGDNRPSTRIRPLPDAVEQAEELLMHHADVKQRFDEVTDLIEGYETPNGMELLSSVYWVATEEDATARTDVEAAIRGVHSWSAHKRRTFKPEHIQMAWAQLHAKGWL